MKKISKKAKIFLICTLLTIVSCTIVFAGTCKHFRIYSYPSSTTYSTCHNDDHGCTCRVKKVVYQFEKVCVDCGNLEDSYIKVKTSHTNP